MAFDGKEAEEFPLQQAAEWTANYRASVPSGSTIAHFFGREILLNILNQSGCMGIRVYYALDDNGAPQMIMVGADANEGDQYNLIIAEKSVPCPPFCDTGTSPLKG